MGDVVDLAEFRRCGVNVDRLARQVSQVAGAGAAFRIGVAVGLLIGRGESVAIGRRGLVVNGRSVEAVDG